jgi:hypothetical protein
MKLNTYFTEDKYNWLISVAKNNLAKINWTQMADELVSDCYIHLNSLDEQQRTESQLDAIAVRYMQMQVVWSKTDLKKKIIKDQNQLENQIIIDDTKTEDEILEFEIDYQNKLNHIAICSQQLNLEQRLLFDIVFNLQINNSGKLAKHTGLSRTTCYHLIKDLKQTIRNAYKH